MFRTGGAALTEFLAEHPDSPAGLALLAELRRHEEDWAEAEVAAFRQANDAFVAEAAGSRYADILRALERVGIRFDISGIDHLEALRRATGPTLLVVSVAFIAYGLLGHFLGGRLEAQPVAGQVGLGDLLLLDGVDAGHPANGGLVQGNGPGAARAQRDQLLELGLERIASRVEAEEAELSLGVRDLEAGRPDAGDRDRDPGQRDVGRQGAAEVAGLRVVAEEHEGHGGEERHVFVPFPLEVARLTRRGRIG